MTSEDIKHQLIIIINARGRVRVAQSREMGGGGGRGGGEGEWTRKVEIRQGRNSGYGQSMRDYILTYSRLYGKNVWQLWLLNRGGLNFCTRSTPLRMPLPGNNIKHLAITWGAGGAQWLEHRTRD